MKVLRVRDSRCRADLALSTELGAHEWAKVGAGEAPVLLGVVQLDHLADLSPAAASMWLRKSGATPPRAGQLLISPAALATKTDRG